MSKCTHFSCERVGLGLRSDHPQLSSDQRIPQLNQDDVPSFFFVGAAGRSSEFGVLLLDKSFSSAKYQLSPCFHPHSRGAVGFGWMLELFGFSFGFRSSLERLPI
jgi:hypothetical protein